MDEDLPMPKTGRESASDETPRVPSLLEHAIAIATRAHKGQLDKAGAPYILHPLRLMLAMSTEEERLAAVLHDVVEDGGITVGQLRAAGMPDSVVKAVDLLTKRKGQEYDAFIRRLAPNSLARTVKLADLRDNSNLSRIANPTDEDQFRVRKYSQAIAVLEAAGRGDS
jgi:(p)ppGpp synthase/HD superfamily hydrolase